MAYDVIVTIEEVRAITSSIDSWTAPDMYAKIKIGKNENWHKTGHREDRKHVSPNWTHRVRFEADELVSLTNVPIQIQLWDEDDPDPDDKIDINPSEDRKGIQVYLLFSTNAAANSEFTVGNLRLPPNMEELPGSSLNRGPDGSTLYWQTNRIHSEGCGDDRAELWYRVRVEQV
jgi:hypothetical protein